MTGAAGRVLHLPDRMTDGFIVLDAPALADARAHLAGEDEEMRIRFEAPRQATLGETRRAIERWRAARSAGGPMFAYAVRRGSVLLGGCEARSLPSDAVSISYWIFPKFRGRGLASRAVNLLCQAAETIEGLTRLEAHIDDDNVASRRVAEKSGFTQAGLVNDPTSAGGVRPRRLYVRTLTGRPGPTARNGATFA